MQYPQANSPVTSTSRRRSTTLRASLSLPQVDPDNVTALYTVCLNGDLEGARELMHEVDDVNAADTNGTSYVQYAMQSGNVELLRFLVEEKNGRVNLAESAGDCDALAAVIEKGHLNMIKYMVEELDVKMTEELDDEGLTPLQHACGECQSDIVKYLAEEVKEVDVNETANDGWTNLHYAAMGGSTDIIRYLVDAHDLDPDEMESEHWTPLHVAANRGHLGVIKYLLEDCFVDHDDVIKDLGQNALHLAASEGRTDVVKYLAEEQYFDLMATSDDGETPLQLAAYYGQFDVVKYLVADCNAIDANELSKMLFFESKNGETPYECVLSRLEEHDNADFQPETADFLRMYVTPLSTPDMTLDSQLSGSQKQAAERTLNAVEQTGVHEVSYKIMEYLTLSDVIQR